MTKVLYVMGTGRSGSTILGVVLGNTPDMFYAGELDAWLRRGGVPNTADQATHAFWREIRIEIGDDAPFGDVCWKHFEHLTGLVRPMRFFRRDLRRRYMTCNSHLYDAVAARSGARCVIDTSHYPRRARTLSDLDGIEQYLLYLVRDRSHVIDSLSRISEQGKKSRLGAHAYVTATTAMSSAVYLRHDPRRRMLVAFEEFLAEPKRYVFQIRSMLGLEPALPDFEGLQTAGAFQGNRLLASGMVALTNSSTDIGTSLKTRKGAQARNLTVRGLRRIDGAHG